MNTTKPCQFFLAGDCKNGDKCHYSHVKPRIGTLRKTTIGDHLLMTGQSLLELLLERTELSNKDFMNLDCDLLINIFDKTINQQKFNSLKEKSFKKVDEKDKSFKKINEDKSFKKINEDKSFKKINEEKSFKKINEEKSFKKINDEKEKSFKKVDESNIMSLEINNKVPKSKKERYSEKKVTKITYNHGETEDTVIIENPPQNNGLLISGTYEITIPLNEDGNHKFQNGELESVYYDDLLRLLKEIKGLENSITMGRFFQKYKEYKKI